MADASLLNQRGICAWIDPPKLLSQVVVSVVHVEFRLMLTSLQELVVAQSMTWPGYSPLVIVVICCGSQLFYPYLNFASWHMQPGSSQQRGPSWMWLTCQLVFEQSHRTGVCYQQWKRTTAGVVSPLLQDDVTYTPSPSLY